ncbi:MAG: nucleotide exchange factor GrpE [Chloroflexota bacterium]
MKDRTNGAADPARTDENGDPKSAGAASSGGTRAQERIAGLDTSGAALSELVSELTQKLDAASAAKDEAEAGWQRTRADFANFKRRSETTQAENAGRANDALLLKVVGLVDDFDLAIEHVPEESLGTPWLEGIDAIDRKLRLLLESQGVNPIEAEGQPFDPHEHQAISYEDTDEAPDGTVLKELQRGYYIGDRVLRPAFVAVARNDGSSAED